MKRKYASPLGKLAEFPADKPKTDWSKIGRSSRRKGKKYECVIAGMLRDVTGLNWQSTRNSGRTDLKGDVYCVNDPTSQTGSVIECKNRDGFQPLSMLQGNVSYVAEMAKVRTELLKCLGNEYGFYRKVVFVRVHLLGDLIGVLDGDVDEYLNKLAPRAGILAADGTKYRLIRSTLPLTAPECDRLFGCSSAEVPAT